MRRAKSSVKVKKTSTKHAEVDVDFDAVPADPFAKAASAAIRKLSKKEQRTLELRQYEAEKLAAKRPELGPVPGHSQHKSIVDEKTRIKKRMTEIKAMRRKIGKKTQPARDTRKQLRLELKKLESEFQRIDKPQVDVAME